MYYRRKIFLALLEVFGGKLKSLRFQKLLFLLTKNQEKPVYNFLPYKYGCFSFQSYADKRTMEKYEQIIEKNDYWIKNNNTSYINTLRDKDKFALFKLKNEMDNLSTNDLVRNIYLEFPYFASRSEIIDSVLNTNEINKIKNKFSPLKRSKLFTIGYEGKTVDEYFNILIKNNIKLLCDVRKNPLSMKYGFSKNQLKNIANKLNINYLHIPELGIDSNKRKNLNTKKDYQQLFKEYKKTVISNKKSILKDLIIRFKKYKRVALTCFEQDFNYCHRSIIASKLLQLNSNWVKKYINI